MMKEQELNNLLDKAIGTKGNLQIHSYWMNKTLKGIIEYNKTLINGSIELMKDSIPTKISYFDNDIGYVELDYMSSIVNNIYNEINIKFSALDLRITNIGTLITELDSRVTNTETLIEQINETLVNKADVTEIPTKVSLLVNDNTYILNMDIGVYAVTAEGNLVTYDDADENCIAIAFVTANLQIMIHKKRPSYTVSSQEVNKFFWCHELEGTNVADITDASSASQAILDYNGRYNTQAIITAYNQLDLDAPYSGSLPYRIQDFNNTNLYNDWYLPSCGQLYEIYLNKEAITNMSAKIGGSIFSTVSYFISSSEYSDNQCWSIDFRQSDEVVVPIDKSKLGFVLYIRDIKVPTIKDSITELNTKVSEAEVSISELLSNVYTKSEVDAKILELQTLINNYINGTSQVSELDR